jgi:hypothetical protein
MTIPDPLIQVLLKCESRLSAWLTESDVNGELFRRDPMAAVRAANLDLDEGLLGQLEEIVRGIALKIKTVPDAHPSRRTVVENRRIVCLPRKSNS